MNEHDKHVIWTGAAVATLLVLALGLTLGWSPWVWVPLCLLSTPAAMLITRELDRRGSPVRPEPELPEPQPEIRAAPEPAPPVRTEFASHPVPSAVADYHFRVSAQVHYLPDAAVHSQQLGDLEALARDAIQCRAAEFLRTRQPDEHDRLDDRLGAVLGFAQHAHGKLTAWATEVQVRLPEEDRERLDELARVRKNRQVWEHQREGERNVREYLSTDVFTDPGRAVVWWLARGLRREETGTSLKLAEFVEEIPLLRALTAATRHQEIPQWTDGSAGRPFDPAAGSATPLARFVDHAVDGMPAAQQEFFTARLARLLRAHDHHEAADELRRRLDDPDQLDFDEPESTPEPAPTVPRSKPSVDHEPHAANDHPPEADETGTPTPPPPA